MNYKATSQYKWFRNRFFFHLFSACAWLIVIVLCFLLTLLDTEVNLKDFAIFFLIFGCALVAIVCGSIIIKLLNLSKDNYEIKEVMILNVYEISTKRIGLTILTEATEKVEFVIYKLFLDSAISLKNGIKINVIVGNSNILL